jgi:hypothetical protein
MLNGVFGLNTSTSAGGEKLTQLLMFSVSTTSLQSCSSATVTPSLPLCCCCCCWWCLPNQAHQAALPAMIGCNLARKVVQALCVKYFNSATVTLPSLHTYAQHAFMRLLLQLAVHAATAGLLIPHMLLLAVQACAYSNDAVVAGLVERFRLQASTLVGPLKVRRV